MAQLDFPEISTPSELFNKILFLGVNKKE